MQPVIVCVSVDASLIERLTGEARAVFGEEPRIEFCRDAAGARECFRAAVSAGHDVPVVVADTSLPAGERKALFDELQRCSPWTGTILVPGRDVFPKPGMPRAVSRIQAGTRGFAHDLMRAAVAYRRGKEQGRDESPDGASGARPKEDRPNDPPGDSPSDRPLIDQLLKIVSAKVKELEDREGELETLFRELNVETIQRLLIEREAERMSRRLSALQNNLKNNLFIRSVLHSLINMLQVQFSIDKEENRVIREIERALRDAAARGARCPEVEERLLPRLKKLREETNDNVHRTMTGYARAVQRSLLGEQGFASTHPTNLVAVFERVVAKYREILSGEKTGRPIRFVVEPSATEVSVWIYDFALVNILENLLTNSIRKLLGAERKSRRITLSVGEERLNAECYTVLTWSDNGPGVPKERKQSIFSGDSDKTEAGDHGVGLSDVKATVESTGGFIREEGVPGEGARFIIGIPRPAPEDESL
ncbi:MAG: GHKL domain-containing protein [Spirochaetales bacterium]|nr:GHKL domain-containing protein [Spirochaetales bacterium]